MKVFACCILPLVCVGKLLESVLLFALGLFRGTLVFVPIALLIIPSWVLSAILQWPPILVATYISVATTQRLGPNLRILALVLLPVPLAVWPLAMAVASIMFSLFLGFFVSMIDTAEQSSLLEAVRQLLSTSVLKEQVVSAADYAPQAWKVNEEVYRAMVEIGRPYYGEPLDVSIVRLLITMLLSLLCSFLTALAVAVLGILRLPFIIARALGEWMTLPAKFAHKKVYIWLPAWGLCIPILPVVVLLAFLLVLLGSTAYLGTRCALKAYVSTLNLVAYRSVNVALFTALDELYDNIYELDKAAVHMTGLGSSSLLPEPSRRLRSTSRPSSSAAAPSTSPPGPQDQAWSAFEDICALSLERAVEWGWAPRTDLADSEAYLFIGLPALALLQLLADAASVPAGWMPTADDGGGGMYAAMEEAEERKGGGEAPPPPQQPSQPASPKARIASPERGSAQGGRMGCLELQASPAALAGSIGADVGGGAGGARLEPVCGNGGGDDGREGPGLAAAENWDAANDEAAEVVDRRLPWGGSIIVHDGDGVEEGNSGVPWSGSMIFHNEAVGGEEEKEGGAEEGGEGRWLEEGEGAVESAAAAVAAPPLAPRDSAMSRAPAVLADDYISCFAPGVRDGDSDSSDAAAVAKELALPAMAGRCRCPRSNVTFPSASAGQWPLGTAAVPEPTAQRRSLYGGAALTDPAAASAAIAEVEPQSPRIELAVPCSVLQSSPSAAAAAAATQPSAPDGAISISIQSTDAPAPGAATTVAASAATAAASEAAAAPTAASETAEACVAVRVGLESLDPAVARALLEELAEHVLRADIGVTSAANPVRLHRSLAALQSSPLEMRYMACHSVLLGDQRVKDLVPIFTTAAVTTSASAAATAAAATAALVTGGLSAPPHGRHTSAAAGAATGAAAGGHGSSRQHKTLCTLSPSTDPHSRRLSCWSHSGGGGGAANGTSNSVSRPGSSSMSLPFVGVASAPATATAVPASLSLPPSLPRAESAASGIRHPFSILSRETSGAAGGGGSAPNSPQLVVLVVHGGDAAAAAAVTSMPAAALSHRPHLSCGRSSLGSCDAAASKGDAAELPSTQNCGPAFAAAAVTANTSPNPTAADTGSIAVASRPPNGLCQEPHPGSAAAAALRRVTEVAEQASLPSGVLGERSNPADGGRPAAGPAIPATITPPSGPSPIRLGCTPIARPSQDGALPFNSPAPHTPQLRSLVLPSKRGGSAGSAQMAVAAAHLQPQPSGNRRPFGKSHRRTRSQPVGAPSGGGLGGLADLASGELVPPSPRSMPGSAAADAAAGRDGTGLSFAPVSAFQRVHPPRISETEAVESAAPEAEEEGALPDPAVAEATAAAAAAARVLLVTEQRLAQLHAFTAAVQSVATALSKKPRMKEIMGKLLVKYDTSGSLCGDGGGGE